MPKIAIIEDDASVREALRLLLVSFGFLAGAFPSAEAFLASGEPGAWDCIVTDLCMPCLSGFDLLERLHAQGNAPPVVVVTAFGTSAHRERARRLGVEAFFGKPIDDQALVDAIHWAIEKTDAISQKPNPPTES